MTIAYLVAKSVLVMMNKTEWIPVTEDGSVTVGRTPPVRVTLMVVEYIDLGDGNTLTRMTATQVYPVEDK